MRNFLRLVVLGFFSAGLVGFAANDPELPKAAEERAAKEKLQELRGKIEQAAESVQRIVNKVRGTKPETAASKTRIDLPADQPGDEVELDELLMMKNGIEARLDAVEQAVREDKIASFIVRNMLGTGGKKKKGHDALIQLRMYRDAEFAFNTASSIRQGKAQAAEALAAVLIRYQLEVGDAKFAAKEDPIAELRETIDATVTEQNQSVAEDAEYAYFLLNLYGGVLKAYDQASGGQKLDAKTFGIDSTKFDDFVMEVVENAKLKLEDETPNWELFVKSYERNRATFGLPTTAKNPEELDAEKAEKSTIIREDALREFRQKLLEETNATKRFMRDQLIPSEQSLEERIDLRPSSSFIFIQEYKVTERVRDYFRDLKRKNKKDK